RKRCLQVVRHLARGKPYLEAMGSTSDTSELPGDLIIEGGRGTLGSAPHIHCHLITHNVHKAVVAKKLSDAVVKDFVQTSLEYAWGVTTLLTISGLALVERSASVSMFLRAVHRHWAELVSVGPRYAFHGLPPANLWQQPTMIQVALGDLGVSLEKLRDGFTRRGLAPFESYLRST
ncbi:MAG TPA: hypothetical protein VLM79_20365, partial [Kofleriaceae bacterium]|nr:hypothetical protein [Kofleriaceae bacterium]